MSKRDNPVVMTPPLEGDILTTELLRVGQYRLDKQTTIGHSTTLSGVLDAHRYVVKRVQIDENGEEQIEQVYLARTEEYATEKLAKLFLDDMLKGGTK